MKRLGLVVTLALVAVSFSGPAATSPARLAFRINAEPANLGRTPSCPDGITQGPIVVRSGSHVGTSTICVLRANKRDRPGYAIAAVFERVRETTMLAGGTITSRATYAFRFNRRGTTSRMTMTGRVVGGTGRFEGARGSISGHGFAAQQHPRYRFEIRLR